MSDRDQTGRFAPTDYEPDGAYAATATQPNPDMDTCRLTIPAPLARAFGMAAGKRYTLRLDERRNVLEVIPA